AKEEWRMGGNGTKEARGQSAMSSKAGREMGAVGGVGLRTEYRQSPRPRKRTIAMKEKQLTPGKNERKKGTMNGMDCEREGESERAEGIDRQRWKCAKRRA